MSSGRVAEVLAYPLGCGHEVRWSVPPRAEDVVWCVRCDAPAVVTPRRGAFRHGRWGYEGHKCRCAVCVSAARAAWARVARRKRNGTW